MSLGGRRQNASSQAARRQLLRLRRNAPVLSIAIQQRLVVKRVDVKIALAGIEGLRVVRIAEHPWSLRRQGVGNGVGGSLQRVLLRDSQCGLQFTSVLAARPRQYQRRQRNDQKLVADAHSTQR